MLTEEGNLTSAGASIIRATSKGDADAVRALLAESADVDQRGRGGHTALMVAAIFSHVDIARLLLAAGADVHLKDNLGLTARDWADRRGSWEVAQLISNASPAEEEPSKDALTGKETQMRRKTDPQQSEVEDAPNASAIDPELALQPDTLRFLKFHKQIMAAQERRKAEQARREAEEARSSMSEPGAVATGSSTGATLPEPELHVFPVETKNAPSVPDDQITKAERERSKAEQTRPTATQSARIAATIEHLRLLEAPSQRSEGEVPAKSEGARTDGNRELDHLDHNEPDITLERPHNERDVTIERPAAEMSTRPIVLDPKTSESFNPSPVKRCPECNTTYENPLLVYCAYDATKLIGADDSMFNYSAGRDWSRQTLWALVAIIAALGASVGYLINNYRSRGIVSSAPVAAISNAPVATPTEQSEITRNDSPLVSGELSGMEVDVPEPEYPTQARAEGVSGTVLVRVEVNQKGRVILARSSRGDWRLRAAAVKAAQKATFSPEKLAVRGKTVSGSITYNFVAQTESPAATGSQVLTGSPVATQTNAPSATESSSATGSSTANAGGDDPVVGGPLVGAESNLPLPAYPANAKSRGIQGTITVVVRVNRAGKVISWRTLEGDSQLRAAALKAAKRATFSPAKLPGTGEIVGSITYNFK